MSNSPIKMPFELKQLCEQSLSHMQLAAACGDAEGAARQAEKLIEIARSLRNSFLPADHPRCDHCSEPLSSIEAHSGEHCRQCSLLMSMGAQIEKIRLKNQSQPAPEPPTAPQQPLLSTPPQATAQKLGPQPASKQLETKPAKGRKQPAAKQPPNKKSSSRPESIQLEIAVR